MLLATPTIAGPPKPLPCKPAALRAYAQLLVEQQVLPAPFVDQQLRPQLEGLKGSPARCEEVHRLLLAQPAALSFGACVETAIFSEAQDQAFRNILKKAPIAGAAKAQLEQAFRQQNQQAAIAAGQLRSPGELLEGAGVARGLERFVRQQTRLHQKAIKRWRNYSKSTDLSAENNTRNDLSSAIKAGHRLWRLYEKSRHLGYCECIAKNPSLSSMSRCGQLASQRLLKR